MILVGLGANLPHPNFGTPEQTLRAALTEMAVAGLAVKAVSRFFASPPYPAELVGQPWYVNAVAEIVSEQEPEDILATLHEIEWRFGRVRDKRWAPRFLDLDLLCYHDRVLDGQGHGQPVLPHPRMTERAFVMVPLMDIAPGWVHPVSGDRADTLLAVCDAGGIRPVSENPEHGVSDIALGG